MPRFCGGIVVTAPLPAGVVAKLWTVLDTHHRAGGRCTCGGVWRCPDRVVATVMLILAGALADEAPSRR